MVTVFFGVDAEDEDEDVSSSEDDESDTTLLFRFLFRFLVDLGFSGLIFKLFCKCGAKSSSYDNIYYVIGLQGVTGKRSGCRQYQLGVLLQTSPDFEQLLQNCRK